MRITKQPILRTKSKINRPGYKLRIFAKNRQSNLVHIPCHSHVFSCHPLSEVSKNNNRAVCGDRSLFLGLIIIHLPYLLFMLYKERSLSFKQSLLAILIEV